MGAVSGYNSLLWTLAIISRDGVLAAYIDFAKVFVSHPKLYHKLQGYGISGSVLTRIKDFLSARTQCTKVGNSVSNIEYLISGVIQGSCLGPILFVLRSVAAFKRLVKRSNLSDFMYF